MSMSTNHKYKYYAPKCEYQYVFITSLILTHRTFFQARCEFHKPRLNSFLLTHEDEMNKIAHEKSHSCGI